jgi:uncharacterized protein (TIGR02145 family)
MKLNKKITTLVLVSLSSMAIMQYCQRSLSIPASLTGSIKNITWTSAVAGSTVIDDGGAKIIARGVCWSDTQNPTISSAKTSDSTGTGIFFSNITGLVAHTKYYMRAYAANSEGVGYGNELSFTTLSVLPPMLKTTEVYPITQTSAISGGIVYETGGGQILERGVCWSTLKNPTVADTKSSDGSGFGSFTSNLTGLDPKTTYYVRAYASNSAGVSYGSQMSFATLNIDSPAIFNSNLTYGMVSDIDGNIYKTIQIGTQTWMAENLKTTKFNDNTLIPLITDNSKWESLYYPPDSPAYCWYNNDESIYKSTYGAIYNFSAVDRGKLCPIGWHVPADYEWIRLTTFLGGENVAGDKIKEIGTSHWSGSNNTGATNETGFTGLPGGIRNNNGLFKEMELSGTWWSSSLESQGFLNCFSVYYDSINLSRTVYWYTNGLYVRCIKN